MGKKIYKAKDCLSVPVIKNGKIVQRLSFNDAEHTLNVFEKDIQDALESLPCFNVLFHLSFEEKEDESTNENTNTEDNPEGTESNTEPKEYPEVENVQDAKDILVKQYKVPYQGLRSPETILKKAQELGVSFPNIKV